LASRRGSSPPFHAYTNDHGWPTCRTRTSGGAGGGGEHHPDDDRGGAAVGKVLPRLQGKLDGMAMRVPVPDGSIVDLVLPVAGETGVAEINRAGRGGGRRPLRGSSSTARLALVSSDIIGNPHSSIFDALSTHAGGDGYAKVIAWYDNEWGYSNRVVDLIDRWMAVGS